MDWMDIEFSTDLVNSAYLHLCFLDKVDNFEKILQGAALRHACQRYEQLWLPFAYRNRNVEMVAPIDIYWLWYIHMLQPLAYRRDCRKMLKTTLDHSFKSENRIIPCINNAIEIWYSTYPKERFNIIRNGEYVKPTRNKGLIDMDKKSKLSVDLVSLAETHMHFCYQVALPHFRDKKYLENAEKRYKQFLCLKRMEPDEFLTPSVDILLMWYTHMCNPVAYANDLMQICGKILDNSVQVKPALINDRFILAREKTNELWKRVSAEDLVQPGTKLRSNEGRKQILQMTEDDLTDSCVVVYKIHLGHADLQNLSLGTQNQNLNLKVHCLQRNGNMPEEVIFLHGSKQMWSFSTSFLYNTVQHTGLRVILSKMNKFWCVSGEKTLAYATVDVKKEFSKMRSIQRNLSLEIKLTSDNDNSEPIKLVLDGAVDKPLPVLCDLTLKKSEFSSQTLTSKALRRVWGHEGFPESFRQKEHLCFSATHIMTNHEDEDSFRCRIMHIPELIHSGIEIFFKQKLIATSRLIGSSQLPYPSQVETQDITMAFDPELGERAMLIRNHAGDWGLCIARWLPEADGGLDVRFLKLAGKNKVQRLEIQRCDIEFQSFNANLYSGKLMVNPSKNTIAENLATFWSICVLYILCSPKGTNRRLQITSAGEGNVDDTSDVEEEVVARFADEGSCQFLVAAGQNTETPSNYYMRTKYGSLTHDLLIDAQDIIVEEQKTSRKLLKKESVISVVSEEELPRRKRRSSKMKEDVGTKGKTRLFVEPTSDKTPAENKDGVETTQTSNGTTRTEPTVKSDAVSKQNVAAVKPKKVKKRQSSKLEDMLAMSDDSITKDEVVETKLIKDEKGKKVVVRKISSHISEEVAPSDDSLDEETKEKEEFFKDLDKRIKAVSVREDETLTKNNDEKCEKQGNKMLKTTSLGVQMDGEEFKREETTLIKELVNKRKRQAKHDGNEDIDFTTDRGLDDKEPSPVTFGLYNSEEKHHSSEANDILHDDTKSDTSSCTRETRSMRKQRIAKDRENKFPMSDEDVMEGMETDKMRRKRKKSKQKLDIQSATSDI